jgi:hypothetical protein
VEKKMSYKSISTVFALLLIAGSAINSSAQEVLLQDDFEPYTVGVFPQPPWIPDANAYNDGAVDDNLFHGDSKSLRLGGIVGSFWAALAWRPYVEEGVSVGDPPILIDFWVYNDNVSIPNYGHQWRAIIELKTGPSWTTWGHVPMILNKNGFILDVLEDTLMSYNTLQWYHATVEFGRSADSTRFSYWINEIFIREVALASAPLDSLIRFFALEACAGEAWFDDLIIMRVSGSVSPQNRNKVDNLTYSIYPPNPNPFNSCTIITFKLPVATEVSLIVYDIRGRMVEKLYEGYQSAGTFEATFDGKNLPSGVYFARLTARGFNKTQKLVLMK